MADFALESRSIEDSGGEVCGGVCLQFSTSGGLERGGLLFGGRCALLSKRGLAAQEGLCRTGSGHLLGNPMVAKGVVSCEQHTTIQGRDTRHHSYGVVLGGAVLGTVRGRIIRGCRQLRYPIGEQRRIHLPHGS